VARAELKAAQAERERVEAVAEADRLKAQAASDALRAQAEAARLEAEIASAGELVAQSVAQAERLEKERAEAAAQVEKATAEAARAEASAARSERDRDAANAQARIRTRTNRLLAAIVLAMSVALLGVYSQYRRATKEETAKAQALLREQAALKREQIERQQAERLTMVERGARAKILAQLPSELDALQLGLSMANDLRAILTYEARPRGKGAVA